MGARFPENTPAAARTFLRPWVGAKLPCMLVRWRTSPMIPMRLRAHGRTGSFGTPRHTKHLCRKPYLPIRSRLPPGRTREETISAASATAGLARLQAARIATSKALPQNDRQHNVHDDANHKTPAK